MILSILRTSGLVGLALFILYVIRGKIKNTTALFTIKRQDCRYPLQLRVPSSDVETYRQIFIHNEYDFLAEAEPHVILDAGANVGLASIYFANKYPDAKIYSVEPERSNFELLKKNVSSYPNIFPMQAALWHKNEEINVVDPGLGKWGFMTKVKNPMENLPDVTCHTVPALTIEKIMVDHALPRIDILKIDIEGAEKEVFADTSAWIGKVGAIIVELHEYMKSGCNRSFYCGSNGFDVEWQQGENVYLSRKNFLKRRPLGHI